MRHMDAAGADEKGLPPGAAEGRDVSGVGDNGCFEIFKRAEVHGGNEQDFFRFGIGMGGGLDLAAQFRDITDYPDEDLGGGFVRNDVGSAAALDGADVQSAWAEDRIDGQLNFAKAVKRIEQFFNRGLA